MADFNGERIYHGDMSGEHGKLNHRGGGGGMYDDEEDDTPEDVLMAKNKLREFIRNFRNGNIFPYREQLLQRWRKRETFLEIDLAHLQEYDSGLLSKVTEKPTDYLPIFERAAKDALARLTVDLPPGEELPDFQVLFKSDQVPMQLRTLNAEHVNQLIKVPGIVISASRVQSKATQIVCRCTNCGTKKALACAVGFSGAQLPQSCDMGGNLPVDGQKPCPPNSYIIVPDQCTYQDQQNFKLQEAPEVVPTGEMPRSTVLNVSRNLVDKVAPGTRVSVLGVLSLFSSGAQGSAGRGGGSSVRSMYLKVVGISVDSEGAGRASTLFTPDEEQSFVEMAGDPKIYERIVDSIAPSISGEYTHDIKKALACQLMGGSRKVLPDGMRLRGDINVLLLGDPSTAKSQFLKFVCSMLPRAVYSSGKVRCLPAPSGGCSFYRVSPPLLLAFLR